MHGLLDFKTSLILKRLLILKATHSFALRPLKKSSPKTDLVTNFLNLENRSFENVSFSQ